MESPASLIEPFFEKAEDYGKTTYELSKLRILEKTVIAAPLLISRLITMIIALLFILILTVGIALLLGELLGKSYYGFFIVAAFYLATGIIFYYFLHKWIKRPVAGLLIKQALQ